MAPNLFEALRKAQELQEKQSPDELNAFFTGLLRTDKMLAFNMLNDEGCAFPTFFMLISKIESEKLTEGLNTRNLYALSLYEHKRFKTDLKIPDDDGAIPHALKWMIVTGLDRDGFSGLYDELLDDAVISLITVYKDASILPEAVNLCFIRNRKGSFHHDLVWAIFRAYSIDSLRIAAQFLLSSDERDVALSCKLLHLKPPQILSDEAGKKALFEAYSEWLDKNGDYLYFTGDSFQRTSEPVFSVLNSSAKYIGRSVSKKTGIPLGELSDEERRILALFHRSDQKDKALLAAYSGKLRAGDPKAWESWVHSDFNEQITAAMGDTEGLI